MTEKNEKPAPPEDPKLTPDQIASQVERRMESLRASMAAAQTSPPPAAPEPATQHALTGLITESNLPRRAVENILAGKPDQSTGPSAEKWREKRAALRALMQVPGRTFAILGRPGCGKTVLAAAMAIERMRERFTRVRYTRLQTLMLRLEACLDRDHAKETRYDVLQELAGAGLLILDECGKTGETDADFRLVFEILESRHANKRDTILITNQAIGGTWTEATAKVTFAAWAGNAITDRLDEAGGLVVLDFPGFRQDKDAEKTKE